MTLVFLGWQDESAAPKIAEAAFGALPTGPPPRLTAAGVRSLPPRDPRLFALDLDDEDGRASTLQAAASAALEAGGWYRPEKRPVLAAPDARSREARRAPCGGAAGSAAPPSEPFDAPVVTLYRSTLRPQGALYEPLARTVPVDAGDHAPQPPAD